MGLPRPVPATWMVEQTPGLETTEGDIPSRAVAHLVRWDHLLCGRDADPGQWQPADPTTPVCITCSGIGPRRFVHRDITYACGITYRQLDHWIAEGHLYPVNLGAGRGVMRVFTVAEFGSACLMGALVRAGLRPGAAIEAARTGRLGAGIRVLVDPAEAA